jgi:hypothetical protein
MDMARSLPMYGRFGASLKTEPISCLKVVDVADSHGDTANISQNPIVLSGARMHDAYSGGLAKIDYSLALQLWSMNIPQALHVASGIP